MKIDTMPAADRRGWGFALSSLVASDAIARAEDRTSIRRAYKEMRRSGMRATTARHHITMLLSIGFSVGRYGA